MPPSPHPTTALANTYTSTTQVVFQAEVTSPIRKSSSRQMLFSDFVNGLARIARRIMPEAVAQEAFEQVRELLSGFDSRATSQPNCCNA